MKKSFLKSVTAGVLGLALLSSCSGVMEKMGMHKCSSKKKESSKNSCSSKGKKHHHSSKKEESTSKEKASK